MPFDIILQILQPAFLIKLVSVIFLVMILIFVIIAAKQILDMRQTLDNGSSSRLVQILSFVNIILVFSLLLTAIVIL